MLITGCGAFGKGFGEEFACLGFNVCFVSKDAKNLKEVKDSL